MFFKELLASFLFQTGYLAKDSYVRAHITNFQPYIEREFDKLHTVTRAVSRLNCC